MKIDYNNIILPNLLAIDASYDASSVALQFSTGDSKTDIADKIIMGTKQQSVYLLPAIDELLNSHNLILDDVDAFVLSNGPGRFTGLRIAFSCIQGLAYTMGKKIITVNSLLLHAMQFVQQRKDQDCDQDKLVWVCQKAYGDLYYQARYSLVDLDNCNNLQGNTASKTIAELQSAIILEHSNNKLNNYYFIGSGWGDVFSDMGLQEENCNYYHDPINVKYCFDYANFQYLNHNLLTPYEVFPDYIVNPFS